MAGPGIEPGTSALESGALPTVLGGPARNMCVASKDNIAVRRAEISVCIESERFCQTSK